jgi:two-component system sensor histidine kinase KdpD
VLTGAASSLVEESARLSAETRRELALTIYEEAQHMSELTGKVLDMARLEAGAVDLNRQWQPLEEVVGPVLGRMRKRLADRPVVTDLLHAPPLAWLDPVLVGQVLTNLVDNALKYTPAGTPIEIGADLQPEGVRVCVADHGPGLAPGEEQRVFDKFYRAKSEGAPGGVGLGLTICKAVVEAHEGRIWAENRPGGGARFCFLLPQPEPPPPPQPEAATTASDAS